jgi:hypothetical protein
MWAKACGPLANNSALGVSASHTAVTQRGVDLATALSSYHQFLLHAVWRKFSAAALRAVVLSRLPGYAGCAAAACCAVGTPKLCPRVHQHWVHKPNLKTPEPTLLLLADTYNKQHMPVACTTCVGLKPATAHTRGVNCAAGRAVPMCFNPCACTQP